MNLTFVYIAKLRKGEWKVGCSSNPAQRIIGLQREFGCNAEIVAFAPGDITIESRIHRFLIDSWIGGERFRYSSKLRSIIQQAKRGSIDLAVLPVSLGPVRFITKRLAYCDRSIRYAEAYTAFAERRAYMSMPHGFRMPADFNRLEMDGLADDLYTRMMDAARRLET